MRRKECTRRGRGRPGPASDGKGTSFCPLSLKGPLGHLSFYRAEWICSGGPGWDTAGPKAGSLRGQPLAHSNLCSASGFVNAIIFPEHKLLLVDKASRQQAGLENWLLGESPGAPRMSGACSPHSSTVPEKSVSDYLLFFWHPP